jgi:hypothetical protein
LPLLAPHESSFALRFGPACPAKLVIRAEVRLKQVRPANSLSRHDAKELLEIAKIAKPTVETSDKVRLNLEKFVWSSREK